MSGFESFEDFVAIHDIKPRERFWAYLVWLFGGTWGGDGEVDR